MEIGMIFFLYLLHRGYGHFAFPSNSAGFVFDKVRRTIPSMSTVTLTFSGVAF